MPSIPMGASIGEKCHSSPQGLNEVLAVLNGTIAAFVLLEVCYVIWRVRRGRAGRAKFAPTLPPSNWLTWKPLSERATANATTALGPAATASPGSGWAGDWSTADPGLSALESTFSMAEFLKEPATWASAADGALPGLIMAEALTKIDPDVIHALQFSTANELHGLADMHSYVDAHFSHAPFTSAEGWFERLTGYVAEQKAAAALEAAGHHVTFAAVPNQPVWDLIVDGHPVQIKEGLAGVKDFIAHHGGIDVLTGTDVAAAAHDPAVHGMAALDKDALHSATQNTLDGVEDGFSPDFHLPFITLGFSAWREAKLLWNEKTTIDKAMTHVALDVGGVGFGGFVGAKIGALVGSVIPGPGTVIGTFCGGIIGAVTGKMASTGIRMSAFNEARDRYNSTILEAQIEVRRQMHLSKERIRALRDVYQARFLDGRAQIEGDTRTRIEAVRSSIENDLLLFCESFPRFLTELESQLKAEERAALLAVPGTGLRGLIFPSDADLYRAELKGWFRNAAKSIRHERRRFFSIRPRTLRSLHDEIERFLRDYLFELSSLTDGLKEMQARVVASEDETTKLQTQAMERVITLRDDLIKDFGKSVAFVQEEITKAVQGWNDRIRRHREELLREAGPVGIELAVPAIEKSDPVDARPTAMARTLPAADNWQRYLLKQELIQLELDKEQGKLSDAEYAKLKALLDERLSGRLMRNGAGLPDMSLGMA